METNKIKNLAFGARGALRREIAARIDAVLADASPERLDSPDKVCSLEKSIKERGSEEVVDSFAYTWFNRLCALRFMDAKGYTPAGVVTPKEGSSQPAILTDASQGVFDPEWRFDRNVRDRVTSILSGGISAGANPTESAYAVLLDAVCTQYAKSMPYLFDEVAASSLAMPSGLLSEDSILRRIVDDMDDDACESVEVLGWLYQFYISERKDDFFASNRKAAPDDIAPATQLFTPKWIVRYLVQNSLGRLWMLNNPHSNLAASMDYYIAPEGETEDFLRVHSPEELTLCDPACGSGHILVYAFDLLYDIYREEGYPKESIPELILTNNLFGMEIDNRAAEIAKFALEMKAREKDQDFFRRELDANVTVLESVTFDQDELVGTDLSHDINLLDAFAHMTECGSLFVPNGSDVEYVYDAIAKMKDASELFTDVTFAKLTKVKLILTALKRRFACIVANPPYMPVGNMDQWANSWVKSNYPLAKSDLCTCFIMRGFSLSAPRGYSAILTMQAWMFLDSYKKMRSAVLDTKLIISLIQLGSRAFDSIGGEIVSTAASIFHNEQSNKGCHGVYARLTTVVGENGKSELYKRALKEGSSGVLYSIAQSSFSEIPGKPIAYWVTPSVLGIFKKNKPLSNYADTFRGLQPGDVPRFVRGWYEVSSSDIGDCRSGASKWSPLSSGGRDRRWYGNLEKIVFWNRYGDAIKQTGKAIIPNEESYGNLTIGWSRISSGTPAMRLYPKGIVPGDATGNIRCRNAIYQRYALALLNSSVVDAIWPMMNPNMTNSTGIVSKIPFVLNSLSEGDSDIASLVDENVDIGRMDWDAFETSWNFEWHPLAPSVLERSEQLSYGMMTDARIAAVSLVSNRFARWSDECDNRFNKLKANEETLNRIFANIYGMEGEVSIEVPDDKVSVRRADLVRDVKSLVSYGVGCIMGRYSTFAPGLILADAQQTIDDFKSKVPNAAFLPDEDAIVPVLGGEWFSDDVVAQFKKWLKVVFGEETLEENVAFIENALGKDLRKYFVKDFYKNHCATYQVTGSGKRPIYWMFSSPEGSFQALVYMHRYTSSTVGRILTKYLRECIEKLNAAIPPLEQSDRAADGRQADKYRTIVKELAEWERDVVYPLAQERISIDLDDGVKVNYNKFPYALAEVSGLSTWK